jgi:hypothetical protein
MTGPPVPPPVPVPPEPDYADRAYATPAVLAWARATHLRPANRKAALAFKAWAQAKGLWVG